MTHKDLNSNVSGMNVAGMGGIGEGAKQNIQNILKNSKIKSVEESNAYSTQIMKANGQKGNSDLS